MTDPLEKTTPATDAPMERLGPGDFGAMRRLHQRVLDALPAPDLLKPEPPEFHHLVLDEGAGVVFGIRDEGLRERLIAYGIVLFRLMPDDETAAELGIPETERLCKIAGSSVDPDVRGLHLQQRLIARRLQLAAAEGFAHAYATVAPGNWVSWRNLLRAGFRLDRLEIRYGHLLRYVVYRPKNARTASRQDAIAFVDHADLDAQRALFDDGLVGVVCVLRAGRPTIGFAPRP